MYHVYILASWHRVLYVGMTGDLSRRLSEHRAGVGDAFTARYRVHRLVHLEEFSDVNQAIRREKQLKGWRRDRKIALIAAENPSWREIG